MDKAREINRGEQRKWVTSEKNLFKHNPGTPEPLTEEEEYEQYGENDGGNLGSWEGMYEEPFDHVPISEYELDEVHRDLREARTEIRRLKQIIKELKEQKNGNFKKETKPTQE
jgi:hypothetical protein